MEFDTPDIPNDPDPHGLDPDGPAPDGPDAEAPDLLVVRQRRVAATPERVWGILADRDGRRHVLGGDLDVDLRPGSRGTFRGDDGNAVPARVREVDPPRRLVFDWGGDDDRTTVQIELVPDGADTLVEVVEETAAVAAAAPSVAALAATRSRPVARDAWCLAA